MDENQEQLNEILWELSAENQKVNANNIDKYISRFRSIYQGDFRHLYSDFFNLITRIASTETYSLEQLAENIRILHSSIQANINESDDFKRKITKLYDHLNLDISRIRYTQRVTEQWSNEVYEKNENLSSKLQELATKAESVQKDNVTILGIFSSIVITFVAGMMFSGSVLNNIDKVSIYRLTFVVIVLAFILFNLLQLLLNFLQKVHFNGMTIDDGISNNSIISNINAILFMALCIDLLLWAIYWYRATGFTTFIGY